MKPGDYVRQKHHSQVWKIYAADEPTKGLATTNDGWFVVDPFSDNSQEVRRFIFERDLEVLTIVDLGVMKLKIDNIMRELVKKNS